MPRKSLFKYVLASTLLLVFLAQLVPSSHAAPYVYTASDPANDYILVNDIMAYQENVSEMSLVAVSLGDKNLTIEVVFPNGNPHLYVIDNRELKAETLIALNRGGSLAIKVAVETSYYQETANLAVLGQEPENFEVNVQHYAGSTVIHIYALNDDAAIFLEELAAQLANAAAQGLNALEAKTTLSTVSGNQILSYDVIPNPPPPIPRVVVGTGVVVIEGPPHPLSEASLKVPGDPVYIEIADVEVSLEMQQAGDTGARKRPIPVIIFFKASGGVEGKVSHVGVILDIGYPGEIVYRAAINTGITGVGLIDEDGQANGLEMSIVDEETGVAAKAALKPRDGWREWSLEGVIELPSAIEGDMGGAHAIPELIKALMEGMEKGRQPVAKLTVIAFTSPEETAGVAATVAAPLKAAMPGGQEQHKPEQDSMPTEAKETTTRKEAARPTYAPSPEETGLEPKAEEETLTEPETLEGGGPPLSLDARTIAVALVSAFLGFAAAAVIVRRL